MELTDEIRHAVMLELCTNEGHVLDISNAVGSPSGSQSIEQVTGPDETKLPHIVCSRCKKVWLVVEIGADSYEAAEDGALAQLQPDTPFKKRIEEIKAKRSNA